MLAVHETGTRADAEARLARAASWQRRLQLCVASLWLIDGALQAQAFMFSRGFGRMLIAAARGNPAAITGPVLWTGRLITQYPAAATTAIAVMQVMLGLGIAWHPTVKLALAASVVWALGVWWLGEGLGGLFTAAADPVTGAPGAVIFYAVLAITLWPADRSPPARFAAAAAIGAAAARVLWLVLWGGLCWLTLRLGIWAPGALPASIKALAAGQPRWLAWADAGIGGALAHCGPQASFVLAAVLAVIAVGVFLPARLCRAALGLAGILALVMWLVGQNFGGMFTGTATDPNSAPLLALIAAAYWPRAAQVSAPVPGPAPRPAARLSRPAGPGWWSWLYAHDADAANVVMGLAMASMVVPWRIPLLDSAWVVAFAAAAAWFCVRALRGWRRYARSAGVQQGCTGGQARPAAGPQLAHVLSCGAMLLMLLGPRPGGSAMTATGTAGAGAVAWPPLAVMLAVAMAGSVVVATDRLSARSPVRAEPETGSRLRTACQVATSLVMACLLAQML